jgi:hypothetical protein
MRYTVSVDLGQMNDPTAISIIEEVVKSRGDPTMVELAMGKRGAVEFDTTYLLRHLEQPELRTSYPAIVDRVKAIVNVPELAGHSVLLVDATGVGRPVLDMMRREGLSPIGITITGGNTPSATDGGYHVPKRDLAMALHVLFGMGRLKIAPQLELGKVFVREMDTFVMRILNEKTDSYESLTEKDHDDLVLSVAMAAWWVQKVMPQRVRIQEAGNDTYDYDPLG